MSKIYGYVRISTAKQSLERQRQNILAEYPDAQIFEEVFTGTSLYNRDEFNKLMRLVAEGDLLVFDEVSRLSRNAEEGFKVYSGLYNRGVRLVFLKEGYLNTDKYKNALERQITLSLETGDKAVDKFGNGLISLLNAFILDMAERDIYSAFETAQKEVEYLHKRTSEGVRRAIAEGKQVGRKQGVSVETKKAVRAKEIIRKHSRAFGGSLNDSEVMALIGCTKNSFYKYKKQAQIPTEN